jgi:signal transduction histidine kinase
LIERKERILYAKLLGKILDGDDAQLKLVSLLGYRLMRRAIPLENVLDLHSEALRSCGPSRAGTTGFTRFIVLSERALRTLLRGYSESSRDALISLKERSKEYEAKANHLEDEVRERTGELEQSREELRQKIEEISKDQGAMLTMIEDLNGMNAELSATRERLRDSEKLAILGRLSLGLSHELRNPLGIIENSAAVLEHSCASCDGDAKKWIDRIRQQTKNCNRVIESVLGFSMHEFKSDELFTVDRILNMAVDRCRAGDRVKMAINSGRPLWLRGDEDQLSQALSHLIQNSLESLQGTGDVVVEATVDGTGNGGGKKRVEIDVRDTGRGIEKDMLPLIFEPFFSTKEGGLGLGLPLCNAIVRKHGGRMTVRTRTGETCFRIILPLAEDAGRE